MTKVSGSNSTRAIPSHSEPFGITQNQIKKRFVSRQMKNDQKSIQINLIHSASIRMNRSSAWFRLIRIPGIIFSHLTLRNIPGEYFGFGFNPSESKLFPAVPINLELIRKPFCTTFVPQVSQNIMRNVKYFKLFEIFWSVQNIPNYMEKSWSTLKYTKASWNILKLLKYIKVPRSILKYGTDPMPIKKYYNEYIEKPWSTLEYLKVRSMGKRPEVDPD